MGGLDLRGRQFERSRMSIQQVNEKESQHTYYVLMDDVMIDK